MLRLQTHSETKDPSLATGKMGNSVLDEARSFVGDLDSDGLQLRFELLGVVGAEVQLAGDQANSDICLRAAFVAAVGSGQRGVGGQCGCHVASLLTESLAALAT